MYNIILCVLDTATKYLHAFCFVSLDLFPEVIHVADDLNVLHVCLFNLLTLHLFWEQMHQASPEVH